MDSRAQMRNSSDTKTFLRHMKTCVNHYIFSPNPFFVHKLVQIANLGILLHKCIFRCNSQWVSESVSKSLSFASLFSNSRSVVAQEGPMNSMHSLQPCVTLAGIGKWVGGHWSQRIWVKVLTSLHCHTCYICKYFQMDWMA